MRREQKNIGNEKGESKLPKAADVAAVDRNLLLTSRALESVDPFKPYDIEYKGIVYNIKRTANGYDVRSKDGAKISTELRDEIVKYNKKINGAYK